MSLSTCRQDLPKPGEQNIVTILLQEIQEKADRGAAKYGSALMSFNGRNSLVDAYQELIDLLMYLRQCVEEDPVGKLKRLKEILASFVPVVEEAEWSNQLDPCPHTKKLVALKPLLEEAIQLVENF
jgi:hypothetical protein